MSSVALSLPLELEERLVATAVAHGHAVLARCSGGDELASRLAALRPEYVVARCDARYLGERLLAECDARGVRLVAIADDTESALHARRLGILETFPPGDWDALLPAGRPTRPVPSAPEAPRTPAERGEVVAVWGPHGAPGRTSVAIAIAAELGRRGVPVALADADVHAASVAPALGLLDEAPGFAAACRLAAAGALTVAEFERVADWVSLDRGGMSVLTGIGRPARWPELGPAKVEAALEAARDWVRMTVVDLAAPLEQDEEISSDLVAPRRNGATLAALRTADRVVLVGAADPVGLARLLRAHAELVETVAPDRVTVAVTKVRSSAVGLDPAGQVTQTLARFGGVRDPVLVPWDPAAFDAALLAGRPLAEAAPRSPARLALRELAVERLLGQSLRPTRGWSAWGRRERASATA
ncbi:MAG: hypothetical protein J0G30_05990 [Actinomycetales bacterium]|nr:hypothetical protein [Actinomycetales bacterium]